MVITWSSVYEFEIDLFGERGGQKGRFIDIHRNRIMPYMIMEMNCCMKKMSIVFLTGNLRNGGAQRVTALIGGRLADAGHNVSFLVFYQSEKEYPISKNVDISYIKSSYEEYKKLPPLERVMIIRNYLKNKKPDVAIGFMEAGYALYISALGLKFPKIASVRINPRYIIQKGGFKATLNRWWFKHADAVVFQTKSQLEYVKTMGWHHCTVIPNPVSEEALEQEQPDYKKPVRRIVMAGRLASQKNYPMAIEAMKIVHNQYPEVKLDIFGKGEKEYELDALIKKHELEDCVHIRGWTEKILSEFSCSDIYLLTSNYEGMPNSLMEAMSVGLPCISTDCETGPADLISNGKNGFLVSKDDSNALAEVIIRIIGMSTDQRKKVGLIARQSIERNYNELTIMRQWEKLFGELV